MASDIENLIVNGTPIPQKTIVTPTQDELYWRMHEQGKKRFGSECRHESVKNGKCSNCLRQVIC